MREYFGVTTPDLDARQFIRESDGATCHYVAELCDTDVVLKDTVGRTFPVHISHVSELIAALSSFSNTDANN